MPVKLSTFPPEFYEKVYDLLIELAKAPEWMKDNFVHYATSEADDHFEWRFQGVFGFGGKIWRRVDRYDSDTQTTYYKHDVNAYTEDYTPELRKLQAKINKRLAEMDASFYEE
jgi:hypothetical protein